MSGKPQDGHGASAAETPEQRELVRKTTQLEDLKSKLADQELALTTLQAELREFEAAYVEKVAARYAELDQVQAEFAERAAAKHLLDTEARTTAEQARGRAVASGAVANESQSAGAPTKFAPTESLKKCYRDIAKLLHPDLTTDEDQRTRRHDFMAKANEAYASGDQAALEAILRLWSVSPETVGGEGPGADLVRIIRQIAQVEDRLEQIAAERKALERSDLCHLFVKCHEGIQRGIDFLDLLASQLDEQIEMSRARLRLGG
jgi:chromosome segregation ATPase